MVSGLSLKYPSIELHLKHKAPLVFPLECEWSILIQVIGGVLQIAHRPLWVKASYCSLFNLYKR